MVEISTGVSQEFSELIFTESYWSINTKQGPEIVGFRPSSTEKILLPIYNFSQLL